MSDSSEAAKEWVLDPETEYRFELDPGNVLAITLMKGTAEIFGAELAEGKTYLFGLECKAAVMGKPSTEYVSDETPMSAYMNLHLAFENMRVRTLAKLRGSPTPDDNTGIPDGPPRMLVLGPENSGKTTACKILVNYAVRVGQDWQPMLVNLDPSEGGWTVPGTLSAAPIPTPIYTQTPANPFGSTATSAPSAPSSTALSPLVYWYGHPEIRQNPLLIDRLIRNLGENVVSRHDQDPHGRCSGVIVDTPSSFASGIPGVPSDKKYDLVKACVDAFKINVIVVVGHEKLNVEMQRMFSARLTVVKLTKSGGVVDLEHAYRERVHANQVHHYVYGTPLSAPIGHRDEQTEVGGDGVRLAPMSVSIGFDDLTIYRIGGGSIAPSSALPIGATRAVSELQPVKVDPNSKGSGLLNAVIAILAPLNPDENERYDEEVLDLPVAVFAVVTEMDLRNRRMTALLPAPGPVAGRVALLGSFEWQDQ